MAINDFTGKNIQDTYQRVIQTDGVNLADGTGSLLPISFNGNHVIISGSLTAQTYVVSESITNVSSGSTIFGNSADDIHQLTGSLKVLGTITASGDISSSGDLYGTNLIVNEVEADLYRIKINPSLSFKADVIRMEGNDITFGPDSGEVYNTTISGSTLNLYAAGDIITDIGGDDFRIAKSNTEYFRFNLDPNPKIDVTGDLIIDPSGNDVHLSDASLVVTGSITASVNISSSGDIFGANVLVPTDGLIANSDNTAQNIKFESTSELEINSSTITLDAATINIDSSTGDIKFKDSSTEQLRLDMDGTAGAQVLQLKVAGDDLIFKSQGGDSLMTLKSEGQTEIHSHITASGNISASGDVYADDYYASNNLMMGYDIASGTQLFGESTSKTFLSATNIKLDAPVTASGNISASGDITANKITAASNVFTNNISVSGTDDSNIKLSSNFKTEIGDPDGAGNEVILTVDDQNQKITMTHALEAASNISASGHVSGSIVSASVGFHSFGNITSNSTISASRFESKERLYSNNDGASQYSGDIVTFGSGPGGVNGAIVQGELYYYNPQSYWTKTDADTVVSSSGMLGIAVADDTPTFLVKGIIHSGVFAGFTTGDVLYASTSSGDVQNSVPDGNGDIVRVVGYSIHGSNRVIYFDPDKTFVEVNA